MLCCSTRSSFDLVYFCLIYLDHPPVQIMALRGRERRFCVYVVSHNIINNVFNLYDIGSAELVSDIHPTRIHIFHNLTAVYKCPNIVNTMHILQIFLYTISLMNRATLIHYY